MDDMTVIILSYVLVPLTGIDEPVYINPDSVVSIRAVRENDHLAPGKCVVLLVNDKFIVVTESCADVREKLTKSEEK